MDPRQQLAFNMAKARAPITKEKASAMPRGEYAGQPVDWADIAKSGASALTDNIEGTIGMAGEAKPMLQALLARAGQSAGLDPESVSDATGSAMDYTFPLLSALPDTDQVEAGTNWLTKSLPTVRDVIRHQPTTPFGEAASFGVGWGLDPMDLVPGGAMLKGARKGLSKLGRMF